VKVAVFVLVLICSLFFIQPSYAATNYNIDLEAMKGMSDKAKAEYLDSLVKKYVDNKDGTILPQVSSQEAKEWASLISGAIKTICNDLSISVNAFLQTDAGKITVFLIAYKVIGQDIKNIVLGTAAWCVITAVLFTTFWLLIMPKKYKIKNEKGLLTEVKYVERLDLSDEGRGWISSILAVMFVAVTITCLVIVFN
jgi:hypothetical protein